MSAGRSAPPQVALRPPSQVMRLARMGAFHPTRLSFIPSLLRELRDGKWTFARTRWEMDSRGVGVGVYAARRQTGEAFSLVAFGHDLPPERRSDRVIAEAWDATFALCEGEPNQADIVRLQKNVPLQEAGRCGPRELVLSRANKSARAFNHLAGRLRDGKAPDQNLLQSVGYLMRTTAVYGNGKFGLADRDPQSRPLLRAPFRAEMLAVWLIRAFTFDWAEHLSGGKIPADIKRTLGVGNSTGLGMAPFLVSHPVLLHRWMLARETALARVRAIPHRRGEAEFLAALNRALQNARRWTTTDSRQQKRILELQDDLARAIRHAESNFSGWEKMWTWGEANLTPEGQEALAAAMMEPHGAEVDDLAETMDADEDAHFCIAGEATVAETLARMERAYDWALAENFSRDDSRFWYSSEEKMEPRLGERESESGAELALPLATARDARALRCKLLSRPGDETLGRFLARHPEFRGAARRVAAAEKFPYAEIRDNLVGRDLVPVEMLRCKLSFFGATRFDPKSDKWLRICMFADAPLPCCFDSHRKSECETCPFWRGDSEG